MGKEALKEPGEDGLRPGQLAAWLRTLSEDQKPLWADLWKLFKGKWRPAYLAKLRGDLLSTRPKLTVVEGGEDDSSDAATPQPADIRTALRAAFEGLGTVDASKVSQLMANAVEKGDVKALQFLAGIAGIDVSGKGVDAQADAATVVVLRPFDSEIVEEFARRVRAGELTCPCGAVHAKS